MADEPEKHRMSAPSPLPNDQEFTPGPDPGEDAHAPDDEFFDNLFYESNEYKLAHYRATAQKMANDKNCSVLLHFYALPSYQRTNGTLMAAFIPAEEGKLKAQPATKAPAPTTQSKNNAKR
jgi:hypothetical protein